MTTHEIKARKEFLNPYIAGVLLGLSLLASFLFLGAGLGASGGIARIAAHFEGLVLPAHTQASEYFGRWGEHPLSYYLTFMLLGTFLGGLFSAILANRASFTVERGAGSSAGKRLAFALTGGILAGFASRLAQGCTSGQALTGSALLLTGSFIFLICLFAGGYAAAYFVRGQWND
ncbi:MAG: YeeE/YedE thiosulfate transporter family protein [Pseudomonadota bacterium]